MVVYVVIYVITGDTNIEIDQVGIPYECTFPETVR